jgi:hypothetical protein
MAHRVCCLRYGCYVQAFLFPLGGHCRLRLCAGSFVVVLLRFTMWYYSDLRMCCFKLEQLLDALPYFTVLSIVLPNLDICQPFTKTAVIHEINQLTSIEITAAISNRL